jgi:hypothetical protein
MITSICTRRAPFLQVFSDDEADIDDVYNANEEQDESGDSEQEDADATADGEKPGSALLKKALEGDTGEAADEDANEAAAVS